ncbi:MAG: 2-amino-4-hydroxy-6-hydroxymethyldihydropteridine diphosphokinase [Pseudomonadota bacterium]
MNTALAYVSGGSNLDAESHLPQAARELKVRYAHARFSRCYRNKSVGFEGPDFINFVVELPVVGRPFALRETLQRIEKLCGRPDAAPRWAPRSMDLDLLLFGDQVIDEPGLIIPRPDLVRWGFMLGPLAELAPNFMHPLEQKSIGELWREFDSQAHPLVPVALDLNAI